MNQAQTEVQAQISEKIVALEALVEKHIESFLARGGKLICRSFGDGERAACALTTISWDLCKVSFNCVVDTLKRTEVSFLFDATGYHFFCTECWAFIFGFDGRKQTDSSHSEQNPAFYDLGLKLREKYHPVHPENL